MGWSDARRRDEIRRLMDTVQAKFQCSRLDAVTLVAHRTGSTVNTVQGWLSAVGTPEPGPKGKRPRSPPPWMILDILRYELGESGPVDLQQFLPGRKTRRKPAG